MSALSQPVAQLVESIARAQATRLDRRCYYCLQLILFESHYRTLYTRDGQPIARVEMHPGCAHEHDVTRRAAGHPTEATA